MEGVFIGLLVCGIYLPAVKYYIVIFWRNRNQTDKKKKKQIKPSETFFIN